MRPSGATAGHCSARSPCSTSIAGARSVRSEKSLAYRLAFGADERTLVESEVDAAVTDITAGLQTDVGGRLRG